MKIDYPKFPEKSKFIKPCERAIGENRDALLVGGCVEIQFSPKGYDGHMEVDILETDTRTFEVDWDKPDPSRFPRRIRAAAYALFRTGCFGRFVISHYRRTGILTIQLP